MSLRTMEEFLSPAINSEPCLTRIMKGSEEKTRTKTSPAGPPQHSGGGDRLTASGCPLSILAADSYSMYGTGCASQYPAQIEIRPVRTLGRYATMQPLAVAYIALPYW